MDLRREDVPAPSLGTALIRHTAVGLNYLDIYQREGHYPLPLPTGLGVAGAGLVEAIGEGVTGVKVGDRVTYAGIGPGSYADARLVPADRLVPMPDGFDEAIAAATLQQGITACFLLHDVFKVSRGDFVMFHAAAGDLGTIACQWAKRLGATVIGTVGSDEKAAHAFAHGCDHVIVYSRENVADRVRDITNGAGVAVVYDSVGKSTLEGSLNSLALRGLLVSFGSASGDPAPIEAGALGAKGSLYLTRPRFVHYAQERSRLLGYADAYFSEIERGLKAKVAQSFALEEVADAHRFMESRKSVGSSVIRIS